MKKALILLAVLILAATGWFFGSPLFIDRTVDEALPGFQTLPTRAEVQAMSESEKGRLKDAMEEFGRTAPDSTMSERMPESPRTTATGRFSDADAVHKGSGAAALYELPDGGALVRFEDFRVTNGPALVVLLAKAADPQSAAEVIDGGYVSLGKLKGNVGNQNYRLPGDLDVGEYGSVVIWCELFDVLFSAAPLVSVDQDGPVPGSRSGEVRELDGGDFLAWSESDQRWLSPEAFWLAYAESHDGLTWGRGTEYPPYAEVNETDLFLVETPQGSCLMEFWHERWRRANDVRRWNPMFNDYGGCPYVFD